MTEQIYGPFIIVDNGYINHEPNAPTVVSTPTSTDRDKDKGKESQILSEISTVGSAVLSGVETASAIVASVETGTPLNTSIVNNSTNSGRWKKAVNKFFDGSLFSPKSSTGNAVADLDLTAVKKSLKRSSSNDSGSGSESPNTKNNRKSENTNNNNNNENENDNEFMLEESVGEKIRKYEEKQKAEGMETGPELNGKEEITDAEAKKMIAMSQNMYSKICKVLDSRITYCRRRTMFYKCLNIVMNLFTGMVSICVVVMSSINGLDSGITIKILSGIILLLLAVHGVFKIGNLGIFFQQALIKFKAIQDQVKTSYVYIEYADDLIDYLISVKKSIDSWDLVIYKASYGSSSLDSMSNLTTYDQDSTEGLSSEKI